MLPTIQDALLNYVSEPRNPIYNFTLGLAYENEGHTAGAASFYIRTCEFGYDMFLTYEALIRLAGCFDRQGSRVFTVKGILLRAIALMPDRPEAYYSLAKVYEGQKDWQECYAICTIGLNTPEPIKKLKTDVGYYGKSGLIFEKGVSSWYIGLYDEALNIFKELEKDPLVPIAIRNISASNIRNLGAQWKNPIIYDSSKYENLKLKFNGAKFIDRNYSQCYQDMFVLTMLNGKRAGRYLEIGCADPFYGNNTALLEKRFGWTGISIDMDQTAIDKFKKYRTGHIICNDALKLDYNTILKYDIYDYLQIDCEPPLITYEILKKIPFETHKFAVITFEHDHYIDENSEIRTKSRKYLESFGYKLVVRNIGPDKYSPFEDWWIHPDLIDSKIIEKMIDFSENTKHPESYMLKTNFIDDQDNTSWISILD